MPLVQLDRQRATRRRSATIKRLVDLASSIVDEADALLLDGVLSDRHRRFGGPDFTEGVDFYAEVISFEIDLITFALRQSKGHQTRAAQLLRLRPSTLNAKIKQYGIGGLTIR